MKILGLRNDTGDYDSRSTNKLIDPNNGSNVKNALWKLKLYPW